MFPSLWQSLREPFSRLRPRQAAIVRSVGRRFRPELAPLEDRLVPSATTLLNEAPGGAGDTAGTAQQLPSSYPLRVTGTIFPGDLDYYAINVPTNAAIWAYVDTGLASDSKDSDLTLFDTNGTTVINHNDDGALANGGMSVANPSTFASAVYSRYVNGGTYYLRVKAASNSYSITPYHLYVNVTTSSFDSEPVDSNGADNNDDFATANFLRQNVPLLGYIRSNGSSDFYQFQAQAGDRVWVQIVTTAGIATYREFDARLYDPNHNQVIQTPPLYTYANDDSGFRETAFSFNIQSTGTHFVELRPSSGSSDRDYRVLVSGNVPAPAVVTVIDTTTSDTTPPALVSAKAMRDAKGKVTEIDVHFDKGLDAGRATNPAQYTFQVKRRGSRKPKVLTASAVIYDANHHTLRVLISFKPTDRSTLFKIKGGTIADTSGNVLLSDLLSNLDISRKRHG